MKKKKNSIFKFLFYVLFFSFLVIYFAELTGYYEYKNYKKKSLTEDQIKKFETDIASGKQIDIEDYLVLEEVNYNNKLSKLTSKLSNKISNIVENSVESTFKLLSNLIDE